MSIDLSPEEEEEEPSVTSKIQFWVFVTGNFEWLNNSEIASGDFPPVISFLASVLNKISDLLKSEFKLTDVFLLCRHVLIKTQTSRRINQKLSMLCYVMTLSVCRSVKLELVMLPNISREGRRENTTNFAVTRLSGCCLTLNVLIYDFETSACKQGSTIKTSLPQVFSKHEQPINHKQFNG